MPQPLAVSNSLPAFAPAPAPNAAAVYGQVGYQQPMAQPVNHLRTTIPNAVRQVAHDEPTGARPTGNYRRGVAQPNDFFNNPFAGTPSKSTQPAAAPAVRIAQQRSRVALKPMPMQNAERPSSSGGLSLPPSLAAPATNTAPTVDAPPPPASTELPSNALRGAAPDASELPVLREPKSTGAMELPPVSPLVPGAQEIPAPAPSLSLPEKQESMREFLNDPKQQVQPQDNSDAAPSADLQNSDSRSDPTGAGTLPAEGSPFRGDRADRDATDRLQAGADQPIQDGMASQEMSGAKVSPLSCEEFRQRVARVTIDKVSLDPSPPFHPHVFDPQDYEKDREKFERGQKSRAWRDRDGQVIATGSLVELAYEQVIIKTDSGATEQVPVNRLGEGDLAYVSENWGLPKVCPIEQVAYTPRSWTPLTMTYKASNLASKPRYFEEVNVERYGHTVGPWLQPVVSSAHFFANVAVVPYKMGVHGPTETQYALGYYRPGNCAPWIVPPVPISARGALNQAAVMTGAIWLIP